MLIFKEIMLSSCFFLNITSYGSILALVARYDIYVKRINFSSYVRALQTQPPDQRYVEQLDRLSSMGFADREANLQGSCSGQLCNLKH